jgi:Transposase DNA-binding
MTLATDVRQWAWEEFGDADLGDRRRVTRLVDMAVRLAERPGGRISDVYVRPGESQGAYDFVRNDAISVRALIDAVATSTARRCADYERVIVPIDGSSLCFTDRAESKGLGRVGNPKQTARGKVSGRGLKTMGVAAVGSDGVFLGMLDIQWWARGPKLVRRFYRPVSQRETQRWIDAIDNGTRALEGEAPSTRICFVLDREGDSRHVLKALQDSGQEFVVRSNNNRARRLVGTRRRLPEQVGRAPVLGRYTLAVPRTEKRSARIAHLEIRATRVTLWERGRRADNPLRMAINVVQVRELKAAGDRLHWTLLTNRSVDGFDQARSVVQDYTMRWRIEEFHRTWKSGYCNVEQTQLRHHDNIIRWAMLHVAVATRIERLKGLARTRPDAPAMQEFSRAELRALVLIRHRFAKSRDELDLDTVTIRQAIRWAAELGGFMGGARTAPGSVTLGRGLERLAHYVEAFEIAFAAKKASRKR